MRTFTPHRSLLVSCLLFFSILSSNLFFPQPVSATAENETILQQIVEIPPEINKKFVPVSIPIGGTSRLTVYIYNPNEYALTNVAFLDQLEKLQPGIILTDNPQAATTCGGTVTALPGANTFSLSGGTVGAKVGSVNGECHVSVNVTSFSSGNLDNEFIPGDLTAEYQPPTGDLIHFSNTSGVTETLNVDSLVTPYLSKTFYPTTVWLGSQTRVRISIQNRDSSYALHDVGVTDTLPEGLVLADPVNTVISSNCGDEATVSAVPGETSFMLDGATIPASTTCYFDVYAVAQVEGTFTNTIPASSVTTYEGVTNPNSPLASITVNAVRLYKSFSPTSILAGEDLSTLTITIRNPYLEPLTGAHLVDALPDGELVVTPGTLTTTCSTAGQTPTLTLSDNDGTITLDNGTIPAGTLSNGTVSPGVCTITATVSAPGNVAGGYKYNTIPENSLTDDQGITNTSGTTASIYVNPQSIGVHKSFSPDRFELDGQTVVTITLSNPTSTDVPNVNLTDEMPSGLAPVQPGNITNNCGGTVTVDATSVTLTDGLIPANSSCSFTAAITTSTGASATTYTNTIPAESITGAGITNLSSASDSVNVYPVGFGASLYKYYDDGNQAQPVGTSIRLTLRIKAPEDKALTGVGLTDELPSGLTILASPAPTTSGCGTGVNLSAPAGGSTIQMTEGSINQDGYCYIYVYVSGDLPGDYENYLYPDDLINEQEQTSPNSTHDSLRLSDYTISKSFSPTKIALGGRSVLTINLTNENEKPMIDVWLQDRLDTMGTGEFVVASEPNASTTCNGTLTADPGSNTITLTGGTVPAKSGSVNGSCSITVTIYAQSGGFNTSTNSISVNDTHGSFSGQPEYTYPRNSASASLTVADMNLHLVKSFDPSSVTGGSSSRLTVLLINPNDVPLDQISFTDSMPAGMKVSLPIDIDTSTCGGEVTVAPDRQSFTYNGGYLAAGRRCTISLNATIRVNGNLINTIPANAVSTFIGVTNESPASSTLTNLPGVSVKKYFTPDRILAEPDSYAVLTIHLMNLSNAPVPSMGLRDDFPAGLVVAEISGEPPTNTCGGTFTPSAGDGFVELSGAYLAGVQDPADPQPEECYLTVPVRSDTIGAYRNVIEEGDVTSSEPNVTNPDPAEDTLEVYGTPDMQITKTVSSAGPYNEGNLITYEIKVTNTGDITLSDVQVTDVGEGAVLGSCTPALGGSLAPGDEIICSASHEVTAGDFTEGEYRNIAIADSDQTEPVSDEEIVPVEGGPEMNVKKTVSSLGPYAVGSTVTYTITVHNVGTTTLNNVLVVEQTPDVTLGTCTPALGSPLVAGGSMVCDASYVVTQADVNLGTFTNTVQADTDETEPETDSVITQIAQFPAMAVYKFETSSGPYDLGERITFDIVMKNTGNTTLTNVTVTDTGTELPLGPCTLNEDLQVVTLPTTLQINDILYCEAYHDVTQADIDAGVYINSAFADSDETSPGSAVAEVPMVQIPLVEVVKTGILHNDQVEPDGQSNAGDTITYTFTVTNIGNVTLHGLSIADQVTSVQIYGGPIETLAPGASDSLTFTGLYSLQQEDIDAGTFTNNATVSALDPNDDIIYDSDGDTKSLVAAPRVTLEKAGDLHLDIVEPGTQVDAGDQIIYSFTVTNTGNVTLSDLTVNDPDVTITGGPIASLQPGESDSTTLGGIYTLTQADIDAGTFINTASVTAKDPHNTNVNAIDYDTQILLAVPGISLVKTGIINPEVVTPTDRVDAGDTISYLFTIKNTGNVTLTNVNVQDMVGGVTVSGGPIASLSPGETATTITGVYTLTQADVDAGNQNNTAQVTGKDPDNQDVTDTDSYSVTILDSPAIELTKTGVLDDGVAAPDGVADAGDTITYTFAIRNIGNVTLTDVILTELTAGVNLTGDPILSLNPGSTNTSAYTATYTLTQADVDSGSFVNSAHVIGVSPDSEVVQDDDSFTTPLASEPGITLNKIGTIVSDIVGPDGEVNAGDQIHYVFRVENTGNVTLNNIEITDSNPDVLLTGCSIAELAVGAVDDTSCAGVYTLTQYDVDSGNFSNTASVTASEPDSSTVSDSDDDTQELIDHARLGVAKKLVEGPIEVSPGVWELTYVIHVSNMGNVTLRGLSVEDDLLAVFPSPNQFTVQEIRSSTFTLNWPGFDGVPAPAGDTQLLATDVNDLAVGESGAVEVLVEIIPVNGGPFENSAIAIAFNPKDDPVDDTSQDGEDPTPDEDDDPANNEDPTPLEFGTSLFDPPIGFKSFSNAGLPILDWSVVWINSTNIRPITAQMSDSIPAGTTFVNTGMGSGYPLPSGTLPSGSTTSGVNCVVGGPLGSETVTDYCYYEGPSTEYPRGRVVWEGILGADLGAKTAADAQNEIQITYSTQVGKSVGRVENVALLNVDLDGDGEITGSEEHVVRASDTWTAAELPQTGFAPGRVTLLPEQPLDLTYLSSAMALEIPKLNISTEIVTVPFRQGTWDVTWLGNQAGYLEGSAFPTWEGNTVITAHNTTAYDRPGLFAELRSLSYGDQVIIHAYGMTYTYEVREKQVILDQNVGAAFEVEDYDWITLMTCAGYNADRDELVYRQLVRAVLISVTE